MVSGTQDRHVLVSGLRASARALALSALTQRLFIVMDNAEAAQYMYSDLRSLTACQVDLRPLPGVTSDRPADRPATPDRGSLQTDRVFFFPSGQEIQQSELAAQLSDLGFERVDFVFQPGQYAVRGSIVDIYSYGHDIPFRLDFFGDEIESIREFDIEDQLSKTRLQEANIVGPATPDRTQTANADRPSCGLTESCADGGQSIVD